jgi:hypothetical protein
MNTRRSPEASYKRKDVHLPTIFKIPQLINQICFLTGEQLEYKEEHDGLIGLAFVAALCLLLHGAEHEN